MIYAYGLLHARLPALFDAHATIYRSLDVNLSFAPRLMVYTTQC